MIDSKKKKKELSLTEAFKRRSAFAKNMSKKKKKDNRNNKYFEVEKKGYAN